MQENQIDKSTRDNLLSQFRINYHLINEIYSSIDSLMNDRNVIMQTILNDAVFKVTIYSQNAEHMVEKYYTGPISKIIKKAELDFKQKNKLDECNPDVFSVNMEVNGKNHPIPNEFWEQYKS
jgi:hypothetical protein